jgi:hypothetical protein
LRRLMQNWKPTEVNAGKSRDTVEAGGGGS